jgi:hypothetical protein
MEPEASLCSQEPAAGSYAEPAESGHSYPQI